MNSTRIEREAKLNRTPCIWMQAAVVRRKACEIDYHCGSRAKPRQASAGKLSSGKTA
jgi:hypothetical protein